MQDTGLLVGIGGGIGYQAYEQAEAVVQLVTHLPETLAVLTAIVTDPQFRAQVGEALAEDYRQRIDMQVRAYNDGGWDGSVTAGVEAGRLAVDIASAAGTALGAGKLVALTAKAGANLTADAILATATKVPGQVGVNAFKSADELNALMAFHEWAPAWKPGTQVAEATLPAGTRVRMVVDDVAWNAIRDGETERAFGGWAAFDDVPDQTYARDQLAITPEFKPDAGYLVEIEIVKPVMAKVGVVGAQGSAQGGGANCTLSCSQEIEPAYSNTFRVAGGPCDERNQRLYTSQ